MTWVCFAKIIEEVFSCINITMSEIVRDVFLGCISKLK